MMTEQESTRWVVFARRTNYDEEAAARNLKYRPWNLYWITADTEEQAQEQLNRGDLLEFIDDEDDWVFEIVGPESPETSARIASSMLEGRRLADERQAEERVKVQEALKAVTDSFGCDTYEEAVDAAMKRLEEDHQEIPPGARGYVKDLFIQKIAEAVNLSPSFVCDVLEENEDGGGDDAE
jgi:hypothetical protein